MPEAVDSLFERNFLEGGAHRLCLGLTEENPYLKRQERLTFARCGITDPLSLSDYTAHDGYRGLQRALDLTPAAIVDGVANSGLRGRGGAGFPTGIKWRTVLNAPADQKYIVCNADEGDSGTYADRMIMEGDPFVLIEGMTIAGLAVGATMGYIYIRSEYPHAFRTMQRAVEIARAQGLSRLECLRKRQELRSRRPLGRRSVYLRRRDVAAREFGRQARADPSQASAAGHPRAVRKADRSKQRHLARYRPDRVG